MFHILQEAVVVPHPPPPDTFFLQPRLPQVSECLAHGQRGLSEC